jgi:hypothetical protein
MPIQASLPLQSGILPERIDGPDRRQGQGTCHQFKRHCQVDWGMKIPGEIPVGGRIVSQGILRCRLTISVTVFLERSRAIHRYDRPRSRGLQARRIETGGKGQLRVKSDRCNKASRRHILRSERPLAAHESGQVASGSNRKGTGLSTCPRNCTVWEELAQFFLACLTLQRLSWPRKSPRWWLS